jgi:hypothetical protein
MTALLTRAHPTPWCRAKRWYMRRRYGMPYWRDDKVATLLGFAHLGCPICGKGAHAALMRERSTR